MFFCGISPVRSISSASTLVVQIFAQLFQERIARRAILRALRRTGKDAIEIVAADKQIAREAAPFVERIARAFGEVESGRLARRHLGGVDDGLVSALGSFGAGFFGDLSSQALRAVSS